MTLSDLTTYGLVYVATPYTKYPAGITLAYIHACKLTARLLKIGVKVYSPIAHTHAIAVHGSLDPLDLSIWLPFDEAMLAKADCLLVAMMTGWEDSVGIRHEIDFFIAHDKPVVFLDPEDLTIKTGRRA